MNSARDEDGHAENFPQQHYAKETPRLAFKNNCELLRSNASSAIREQFKISNCLKNIIYLMSAQKRRVASGGASRVLSALKPVPAPPGFKAKRCPWCPSKGNKPGKIILNGFFVLDCRQAEGLSGARLICTFLLRYRSAV
ncbi:hypothetical protein IHE44_0009501 [Lamprotornis superbus]|uniref:Uncharacterized protein n=1 Tax=Lamprotornis superbus TaxID=245042 RepID=A0A835P4S2_9PASS|nr:hypothetical protein IHE44_0009501 [Lamprotornis superbus]